MFELSPMTASALNGGGKVVALESTVIAHGLPEPANIETALACETAVRSTGAVPATIAILGGRPVIGMTEDQIREVASSKDVAKVNLANLGSVVSSGSWGATTVAASLHIADLAGIKVFATGGIGGVHRGAGQSFDISSDLTALARYPLITVCAGAKAILDLAKTLEVLETCGVPVVGYGTDELPAFYSRSSGLKLDLRADSPSEVARIALNHWKLGLGTSILVVAPVPAADEIPGDEIAGFIEEALAAASSMKVSGKAVTPFLLARIAERSAGRSLKANISLLKNNAKIAGQIAVEIANHMQPARDRSYNSKDDQ